MTLVEATCSIHPDALPYIKIRTYDYLRYEILQKMKATKGLIMALEATPTELYEVRAGLRENIIGVHTYVMSEVDMCKTLTHIQQLEKMPLTPEIAIHINALKSLIIPK